MEECMPAVGVYERFCGLHDILHEKFTSMSNIDLIWDATCGPIYQIALDCKEGRLPKYIAIERLRQHVTWVNSEFGPMWEMHTWEQYLEGDWHEFDCIWDYHLWDLFVDNVFDFQPLLEAVDGEIDPDPIALAKLACQTSNFVAMYAYDYGWVYVFNSPYLITGRAADPRADHMGLEAVEAFHEGNKEAPAIPPAVINAAIDMENEYDCTCATDGNLERYRCQE
jgi:hypothetical protein